LDSKAHFDRLAVDYDGWKRRNAYYYHCVKQLYEALIPKGSAVLEIGCGTGDILASLQLSFGTGIDISNKMIEVAKRKYEGRTGLEFKTVDSLGLDQHLKL